MPFGGFKAGAWKFLAELAANNDRAWFEENRGRYERELLEPALAFVEELGPRLDAVYPGINFGTQRNGSGSVMRIHRDVRFARDKSPYKTNLGVIFWLGGGKKVELPCFYFHLDAESSFFYGGQHQFTKEVLERYRAAVDDPKRGAALATVMASLDKKSLPLMEEPAWKKTPRPFAADHPREALLRLAGIGVGRNLSRAELADAGLPAACAAVAEAAKPLLEWLAAVNRPERA